MGCDLMATARVQGVAVDHHPVEMASVPLRMDKTASLSPIEARLLGLICDSSRSWSWETAHTFLGISYELSRERLSRLYRKRLIERHNRITLTDLGRRLADHLLTKSTLALPPDLEKAYNFGRTRVKLSEKQRQILLKIRAEQNSVIEVRNLLRGSKRDNLGNLEKRGLVRIDNLYPTEMGLQALAESFVLVRKGMGITIPVLKSFLKDGELAGQGCSINTLSDRFGNRLKDGTLDELERFGVLEKVQGRYKDGQAQPYQRYALSELGKQIPSAIATHERANPNAPLIYVIG